MVSRQPIPVFGLLPPFALSSPVRLIVAGYVGSHYPQALDANSPIKQAIVDVPAASHRMMMIREARVQPQGTVVTPDLSVVLSVDHGLVQLYRSAEAAA